MVEVKNLEQKPNDQEQLTQRKTEDTDEMVLHVINNKLNIEMSQISIDRSHKLGKRKGPGQKSRVIIAKFTR